MPRKSAKMPAGGPDPFEHLLGYHLRRLSVLVMADLTEALSSLGLKAADASVLFMIEANPGITQSDVGKALGILRANMAPLIAGLLGRGFVEREPVDGRSHALRLSAAGLGMCLRAKSAIARHEDRVFSTLSPGSRARMISQLRGLWMGRK
jgi:DNA-binding MarR family transcriptional regulator